MAEEDGAYRTPQQAMALLAKGNIPLWSKVNEQIDLGEIDTTGTLETEFIKRIVARLSTPLAAKTLTGVVTIEFSDDSFTTIKGFVSLDIDSSLPQEKLMGANVAGDTMHYIADFDVETIGKYARVRVRNDTGANDKRYNLTVVGKVM